jgi:hypothetical protein
MLTFLCLPVGLFIVCLPAVPYFRAEKDRAVQLVFCCLGLALVVMWATFTIVEAIEKLPH